MRLIVLMLSVLFSINVNAVEFALGEELTEIQVEEERIKNKVVQVKADLADDQLNKLITHSVIKNIQITVVELQDRKGLKYIGGVVSDADLSVYLSQMKHILGDKFTAFRAAQSLRDHHTFHMTLVNPYELQAINQPITYGEKFSVSLQGLGRVEKDQQATYFVVANSSDAQHYRSKLALSAKDFHVTLGFSPNDIYGVSKNTDTLIYDVLPSKRY